MSFLQVVGVTEKNKIDLVSPYQLERGVNSHEFFLSSDLQADRASAGLVSARSQILLLAIFEICSNCLRKKEKEKTTFGETNGCDTYLL